MRKSELKKYLLGNEETLSDVICSLNCWNLCLDYLLYYKNDREFFDTYFNSPSEAVVATQSGFYSFNDDYVRVNGYGLSESFNEEEKDEKIKDHIDDIVDCLVEYHERITIDDMNLKILLLNDDEEEE